MSLQEQIAGHYMVQCQKGEPFECPHLADCPHEDKDICLWQLEEADSILALVRAEIEQVDMPEQARKEILERVK